MNRLLGSMKNLRQNQQKIKRILRQPTEDF